MTKRKHNKSLNKILLSADSDMKLKDRWGIDINKKEAGGLKFDTDKTPLDLIDTFSQDQLARVLQFGAKKYARHNWRKGISYSRLIAAAQRHLASFNDGEDLDSETGLPHAAHAMCCCMFIIWMSKYRADLDDRWKPEVKGE